MDYVLIKVDSIGSNTYMLLMKDLEKLGIRWWSGKIASGRNFSDVQATCVNDSFNCIAYRTDNSQLVLFHLSTDNIPKTYISDTSTEFIEQVRKYHIRKTPVCLDIKHDSSRWNTKCRKCGCDAYDSGFSYECSKGCC